MRISITKESITNADVVLYQLGELLIENNTTLIQRISYWFPTSYIYHSEIQSIWQKLQSKEYCKKILPLFGAKDIIELKGIIEKSKSIQSMNYNGCFERTQNILYSIKLEDIGTLE